MHHFSVQKFSNIRGINPKNWGWGRHFNIKDHKLMIRGIIDSFLNSFWTLHKVWMVFRPSTSKIFSINLDNLSFRISLSHFLKNMFKLVVDFFYSISSIVKGLSKVFTWILARNWNLFGQKVCSSSVSGYFLFAVVMYRKIRAMDFLWSYPEYIRLVVTLFLDFLYELISRWKFNGRIFFKFKFNLDWLFFHVEKCLILL